MALSKTSINVVRICSALALLAVVLVATLLFHVQDHIGDLIQWIEDNKVVGSVSFVFLYALFTVLPVPAALMSLGAGAIFGLLLGSLLVFAGAVIGEVASFIVGRFLLRDWVASLTKQYPVWQAVEAAVAEEGWKMVLLLRLSPVIPFALLNYMLSLTPISFPDYVWTSALGIIPGVLAYVYIGSLANNVGEIAAGRTKVSPTVTIVSAVVSGIFIIGAMVLITFYARRAIVRRLEQEHSVEEGFAVDAIDQDVREAERLIQSAERHV